MVDSSDANKGQWNGVAVAAVVLLALSFALGGASRQNELRLAIVELAALPALGLGLHWLLQDREARQRPFAWTLLAAALAVPLIQLVPLPPGVAGGLPGRAAVALAYEVSGVQPGWGTISLTPDLTWRGFLAMIPAAAMFLAAGASAPQNRLRLVHLALVLTVVSIALGFAQLASRGEALYPWRTTDAGIMSGLFANRNHLATLCLMQMPFAAVIGARAARRRYRGYRVVQAISIFFVALSVIALCAIQSRMGLILVVPALGASAVAAWQTSGRRRPSWPIVAGLVAATVAIGTLMAFASGHILSRFSQDGSSEARFEMWPTVIEAAGNYAPLGSGSGSFDAVFRSVEPLATLDATFTNEAHNEYIQIWLEAGWLGAALLVAFFVWFGRRSLQAWRVSTSTAADLQRAATIAIGVVLLHSVVDYPIRTATISVVFALCAALLESKSQREAPARGG